LILSHQDELRVYRQGQAYRRHGWVVVGRRLVSVERSVRIPSPGAAASLLPPGLPELFDTAQLAEAAAIERRLAQRMTYCLRAVGVLHTTGKRGNAIVHRRTDKVDPRRRLRCTGRVDGSDDGVTDGVPQCVAVASWGKCDTRVADPRLRRTLVMPVLGLEHPASQPARASR
jgi:hypothetical protein